MEREGGLWESGQQVGPVVKNPCGLTEVTVPAERRAAAGKLGKEMLKPGTGASLTKVRENEPFKGNVPRTLQGAMPQGQRSSSRKHFIKK